MGQIKISLREATDRQLNRMAMAAKVAKAALAIRLRLTTGTTTGAEIRVP